MHKIDVTIIFSALYKTNLEICDTYKAAIKEPIANDGWGIFTIHMSISDSTLPKIHG